MDEQNIDFIWQYILDNYHTYTQLTIEENLLSAGYSQTDINAVYAEFHDEFRELNGWRAAPWNPIGCLLLFPLIPLVAFVFIIAFPTYFGQILVIAYIITILMRVFLPRYIEGGNRGIAKGIVYGFRVMVIVFVVFPVLALALMATCYVWIGSML
jgi:hypothetical protein